MTVYTDEVNIYNTDAIAQGIAEAGAANEMVTSIGSTGVQVHPAGQSGSGIVDYTQIDANGVKLYKGGTQIASFGDSATIGKENGPRTVIQSSGVDFYGNADGSVNLAHIGYASGNAASGTATAPYYTFGTRLASSAVGNYSIANGTQVTASGYASHAEGSRTRAIGATSHAEGSNTEASGLGSHAEGSMTKAIEFGSHAEGSNTEANGPGSHAEGVSTEANGDYSHAEGNSAKANGKNSHAQNEDTVAAKRAQTVLGTRNIEDESTTTTHPSGNTEYGEYAFIIGNGTSAARSNAFAVDWDGNVTVNNHSSPIGSVLSNTKNSISRSGTAIDTMTNGASVTLTAGVWIVFGYWSFNTGAAADNRNMQVALGTSDATNYYERVRVKARDASWATLECSCIVNTTSSSTTVYVKGAASVAQDSSKLDGSHIKAVRIL